MAHLTIAGAFDVSLSLAPRVTAGDVRLANAPWRSEPSMVRAGRVTIVMDLVSLWSGPTRVRELEIENAHLLMEADVGGRGNWVFAPEPGPAKPAAPAKGPAVVLERAAIRGLEMVVRSRPEAAPVTLGVRELEARLDPATRMIDVRGGGQFSDEHVGDLGSARHPREALPGPRRLPSARRPRRGLEARGPRAG